MKFLKFKYKDKIYLFEEKTKQELINTIIKKIKKNYTFENIEFMSSNVFKIKNKENEELKEIFNS
tara:strand:- start:1106 stop:1300 length:195 start_codon:yes stop_codon:yes gene_type:complete